MTVTLFLYTLNSVTDTKSYGKTELLNNVADTNSHNWVYIAIGYRHSALPSARVPFQQPHLFLFSAVLARRTWGILLLAMAEDYRQPSWASKEGICSLGFVSFSATVCFLFIRRLIAAIQEQTLASFILALHESAWAQATFVDYLTGALVASTWVATHSPPRSAFLPNWLWAALLPGFGNVVLYTYLALCVFRARSVRAVLVPYSSPYDGQDEYSTPVRTHRLRLFTFAFLLLGVVYFSFLLRAFIVESVMVGYHDLKTEPLLYVTFLDNLMGIAFAVVVIGAREGLSCAWLAWFGALCLFGSGVFCLYALLVVRDADKWSMTLGGAWGTGSTPHMPIYV